MVSDRIFFGGFASGLDTAAIIDALIAVHGRPILLAEDRRATIDQRKDSIGQINSSLANLLATLADLKDPTIVSARRASTDQSFSDPSKLLVSATSAAAIGSFTVEIISLATSIQTQSTAAIGQAVSQAVPLDQAGFDTAVVAGTFTIDGTEFTIPAAAATDIVSAGATGTTVDTTVILTAAGLDIAPVSGNFTINGTQITFDASVDSIDDVLARINSSAAGVTATFDTGARTLTLTRTANGPTAITLSDGGGGNFLESMQLIDGVGAKIGTETLGTDLISLTDVVNLINGAAMGVTASIVNDADARPNLLQLTSASNIQLGNDGDTSNFLSLTHVLESPTSTTRTSVRNLGTLSTTKTLDTARLQTALTLPSGSFKINGVSITYDETVDSLNNVITRINQSSAAVTATYDVQTDQLIITSDTTGSIATGLEDVTGNFLAALGVLSATQTLGVNASYKIDGGATQYSTRNDVSDAVAGVTLTFIDETDVGTPITVTVSADTGQLSSKLNGFVEQYNSTVSLLRGATKFVEDGTNGVLLGDSGILNLMRNLRSLVTGPATGVSGDIQTLADIGLNFGAVGSDVGTTGLLLFTSSTFDEAIKDSAIAVTRMLTTFSASASLKAGGDGAVVSVTGTPTNVTDSGDYEFTTTASGSLTMTFQADDGSALQVTTATISPGEVNTTLIPGLTITFPGTLIASVDVIEINTVEEGVAKTLHEYVNSFTRSGGVMETRGTAMQARIDDINDQIDRMQTRLDSRREQLIRKFAQLEVTMQRLQNQQAALSGLVNQLQANRRTS